MRTIQISPSFNRDFTSPHIHRTRGPIRKGSVVINSANVVYLSPGCPQPRIHVAQSHQMPPPLHFQHPPNKVKIGKQNCIPAVHVEKKILPTRSVIRKVSTTQIKRPSSAYTSEIDSKKFHQFPREQNQNVEITPFNQNDNFLIDSFCPKLTKSIILKEQIQSKYNVNDFHKLKFLGKGKFGQVHLVIHKKTGFICAMKIITKKVVKEEKVQSQLAKQLKIHNSLKHSNVIDFYGFFVDSENIYVLIEYGCQASLFSKLKGRNRLEQEQIKPIAKGIVEGVRYIHRMGYIHRDLKPENVILQFGISKICDFGWANTCYDNQLCRSFCGTPLYLSPEMVKKQHYNNSIDIWAVGLVVYELLVGRGPFSIWSENDLPKILDTEVSYPPYIDKTNQIEQFIGHCLEKNGNSRFDTDKLLELAFLSKISPKDLEYQFYENCQSVLRFY